LIFEKIKKESGNNTVRGDENLRYVV